MVSEFVSQGEAGAKRRRVGFWVVTSIFSLMMAASGIAYLTALMMVEGFAHLGFPSFFRIE